jgi:hypothetical protein
MFEEKTLEADADADISEVSDDNYDVKNEAEVSALYKLGRNGPCPGMEMDNNLR